MKDSGIEWIGEMPSNWSLHRMKSCITDRTSGAWGNEAANNDGDTICLRVADFDYSRYRFKDVPMEDLTVRNYDNSTKEKLMLSKGDILIEKSGGGEKTPVGRTVIFDKDYPALYANFIDRLRVSDLVLNNWMQYVFVTFYKNDYSKNYIKQTTGIQNLDLTNMLASERIPVPSIDEQQRIVSFLDTECSRIDAVIEQTQASIEGYKKLKQAVITQAVTKGIRPNRPMKDSGIEWIGEIPEDWETVQLKRIAQIQTGNTPSKNENDKYYSQYSGYLWIKAEDLGSTKPIEKTTEYLTDEGIKGARLFPPNTVFVCCIASVGKVGYCKMPASCNQQINGLIFHNVYWKYGFYFTIAQESEYINNASGNVMKIINSDKQSKLMCPLPTIEEQHYIVNYLDSKCAYIDVIISKKEKLLSELETYKKSLVYEYVTGKKEVGNEL